MDLSQIINYFIALLFTVATGAIVFISLFGVYAFIRYGRTPVLTLTISGIFVLMFLIFLGSSLTSLFSLFS